MGKRKSFDKVKFVILLLHFFCDRVDERAGYMFRGMFDGFCGEVYFDKFYYYRFSSEEERETKELFDNKVHISNPDTSLCDTIKEEGDPETVIQGA